ncbi:MAG TPA: outer membrane lipoprotein-sorting protein [Bacteroidales bacterium]|nr:outer membrane lipoprotein-sorting protein [Bacteroidales bacterium]
MKKTAIVIISLFMLSFGNSNDGSILDKIDRNLSSKNRIVEAAMTVNGKRTSRTITSKSWSEGTKRSFTEYLSPASEKGTKMLKLEGQLWIYSPSTDRIVQISGNMLRQSVMGSDLSYEDMMDDRKLQDVYTEKITGREWIGDRKTWIVQLTAKVTNVAYYSQKMWVDTARYVPLKQELYAKSGQLLKKIEYKDVKNSDGRWFPHIMIYKDMMKDGKGTEFKIISIKFDQAIPDYIFSKASLKK